ncbi:hypothetical protein PpBr36_08285 [Pyricularia pennisetigena]|uniref:hypothetical protein n=1 Tax=Pyricularia pennisetigena TaxID=1578925 RepID=UPI001154EB93|nr:hypothetical protein PpBr36_08285 [Pyricularia pennisetigena]TLS24014.1 hypothetical protein PpBr36_08285 [Pyricularia pennisetigena]
MSAAMGQEKGGYAEQANLDAACGEINKRMGNGRLSHQDRQPGLPDSELSGPKMPPTELGPASEKERATPGGTGPSPIGEPREVF